MKLFPFIISKLILLIVVFTAQITPVSADENKHFINQTIEQSVLNHYRQVLLNSFDYYSKKLGFTGIYTPNTIHNFPVLIENNIEYVVQNDFHTELFFSRINSSIDKTKEITRKYPNKVISISNIPVTRGYLSSMFGLRKDPFHGSRRMHNGIDIAAKLGSPVSPLGEGTVVYSGYKAGFGNLVEIRHGKTVVSRYAHLKQYFVDKGQKVNINDQIGTVGTSGRSTGPHLHLEVLFNDKQVDPQIFLVNHFGSRGNTRQIAQVKSKTVPSKKTVADKNVTTIVADKGFPKVSDYPQVSYQDYVDSVDGLFGFTAPD